jgi:hypothetical protein
MTSKQMQREIAKLKSAGEELSPGAAKRLRSMEKALVELQAEEATKAEAKSKLAHYGDVPTAHRAGPVDSGLDGAAWINFYNRHCDPKGLAPAKLGDSPERERKTKKTRESKPAVGTVFSFNNRRVTMLQPIPVGKFIRAPQFKQTATAETAGQGRARVASSTVNRLV